MTEILSKIFIKSNGDIMDPAVRKSYGTMSGAVGIAVNVILAVTKLILGMFTASVSITADAFNNLSDAGSSFITLISFRLSSKPADREHPFGHARFEYIASMVVAFLILHVGADLLFESMGTLLGFSEGIRSDIGVGVFILLAASMLLKLWLGLFYSKIGKKINSEVIFAASKDSVVDSVSTGATLISAITVKLFDFVILDALVGIGVSVLIIVMGCKIFNEAKNLLLGNAPSKEVYDNINKIAKAYPDILAIHDLLVHNYGPNRFVASFHAEVDGTKDIYSLHDTIDSLEREIKESLGIACTIHMDPMATNDENTIKLREMLESIVHSLGESYKIHDFRVGAGRTQTKLIFDLVLPYGDPTNEVQIIKTINDEVMKKAPKHYCVITIDRE